ncbi:MAG: hypothetical protein JW915_15145 [Chitinispirillaceae bacterium]|nr:hypothetical protein [Chitinispirillaceae bacterium]
MGLFDDGDGTIEPVVFVAGTANFGNAETKEGKMSIEGSVDFFVSLLKNSELKHPDTNDNAVPAPVKKITFFS